MPVNGNPLLTVGAFTSVRPRILDANGAEIPGVYSLVEPRGGISFTGFFLDPGSGFAYAGAMGTTWISATVFVNGKLFTDSVHYRTRYRDLINVMIGETRDGKLQTTMGLYYSDNLFMGSDGRAMFMNTLRTPVDIVFERPAEVIDADGGATGGDILGLQPGMSASRRFTALGDYFFTVKSETRTKRSSITVKTVE